MGLPQKIKSSSNYIGVSYNRQTEKWHVQRHSKDGNKLVGNGSYYDEKNAAHASDNLARKLMENNKQKLELNFPNDHNEAHSEKMKKSSNYIGVSYNKKTSRWY